MQNFFGTLITETEAEYFLSAVSDEALMVSDLFIGVVDAETKTACGILSAEVMPNHILAIRSIYIEETHRKQGAAQTLLQFLACLAKNTNTTALVCSYSLSDEAEDTFSHLLSHCGFFPFIPDPVENRYILFENNNSRQISTKSDELSKNETENFVFYMSIVSVSNKSVPSWTYTPTHSVLEDGCSQNLPVPNEHTREIEQRIPTDIALEYKHQNAQRILDAESKLQSNRHRLFSFATSGSSAELEELERFDLSQFMTRKSPRSNRLLTDLYLGLDCTQADQISMEEAKILAVHQMVEFVLEAKILEKITDESFLTHSFEYDHFSAENAFALESLIFRLTALDRMMEKYDFWETLTPEETEELRAKLSPLWRIAFHYVTKKELLLDSNYIEHFNYELSEDPNNLSMPTENEEIDTNIFPGTVGKELAQSACDDTQDKHGLCIDSSLKERVQEHCTKRFEMLKDIGIILTFD
ncbi:MAG: hypothetical protein IJ679_12340 [Lachnospiraceae bacterium]|nr:hypothetical protein [Lachnospiraceae bacterium]